MNEIACKQFDVSYFTISIILLTTSEFILLQNVEKMIGESWQIDERTDEEKVLTIVMMSNGR